MSGKRHLRYSSIVQPQASQLRGILTTDMLVACRKGDYALGCDNNATGMLYLPLRAGYKAVQNELHAAWLIDY